MAKQPSFVASLNYVANAERRGQELFEKWAAATDDEALRGVLSTVAVREAEHSWAFEKRLDELGFPVKKTDADSRFVKLRRLMGSSKTTDAEKFAAFGVDGTAPKADGEDQLLTLLADRTIDPRTGELIGRFICEERDSGRLLQNAYRAMNRRSAKPKSPASKSKKK